MRCVVLVMSCIVATVAALGGCPGLSLGAHTSHNITNAVVLQVICTESNTLYQTPAHLDFVTFERGIGTGHLTVVSSSPLPITASLSSVNDVLFATVVSSNGDPIYIVTSDDVMHLVDGTVWLHLVRGFTETTTGEPAGHPATGTAAEQRVLVPTDDVYTFDFITDDPTSGAPTTSTTQSTVIRAHTFDRAGLIAGACVAAAACVFVAIAVAVVRYGDRRPVVY